jgi:hypothetical protein
MYVAFSYVKPFYGNFLSRSICNVFHKIVLKFYVFFCLFTPNVDGSIFPALFSGEVVQSCQGQAWLRYLHSAWGP